MRSISLEKEKKNLSILLIFLVTSGGCCYAKNIFQSNNRNEWKTENEYHDVTFQSPSCPTCLDCGMSIHLVEQPAKVQHPVVTQRQETTLHNATGKKFKWNFNEVQMTQNNFYSKCHSYCFSQNSLPIWNLFQNIIWQNDKIFFLKSGFGS